MAVEDIGEIPAGLNNSRVLNTREAHHAMLQGYWRVYMAVMKYVLHADVTAPAPRRARYAGHGLGDWTEDYDDGWDAAESRGGYYIPESAMTAQLPTGMPVGTYPLASTDGTQLGAHAIIGARNAVEVAVARMRRLYLRAYAVLRKVNTYRSYLTAQRLEVTCRLAAYDVVNAVQGSVLPQNPVTGPRYMSVRHWAYGIGWGKHCWRPALKRHVGRPAIPGWRWLEKRDAYNKARRKTTRPYRYKRRKHAKPRATRYPRPINPG